MHYLPLISRDRFQGLAVVDDQDAALADYRWRMQANGYAVRGGSRREGTVYLHRAVLGLVPEDGVQVDHINGDRLDCRRANLRAVTGAINALNQPAHRRAGGTSSTHRGVTWDAARGRWKTQTVIRGVRHTAGRYDTEEDAAAAIRALRSRLMPGEPNR